MTLGKHHEETPLLGASELPNGWEPAENESDHLFPEDSNDTSHTKINDDYIISLIRRTSGLKHQESTLTFDNTTGERKELLVAVVPEPKGTSFGETIIHLVKGYIGCGILSLPWAISQLGIPLGLLAISIMSLWSSYNCWTVVKLKRYIERTTIADTNGEEEEDEEEDEDNSDNDCEEEPTSEPDDDEASKISYLASASVASSNVTYPDVGEWAYGRQFQAYVAVCICAQQLAICTVFCSFVGENVYATLSFLGVGGPFLTRRAVATGCLPFFVGLSCFLPNLRSMVPFMTLATVLMVSGFATLGWIGLLEWGDRPPLGELPGLTIDRSAAMALCGILYSFEGICIILPVESSMKQSSRRDFGPAFGISMAIITMLLCGMAAMGVLAFGEVSNGSITAFLLEKYKGDRAITVWLMLSNALVTLSIAFSYPLQLFPAVELVAPAVLNWRRMWSRRQQRMLRERSGLWNRFWTRFTTRGGSSHRRDNCQREENTGNDDNDNDNDNDGDLEGFEPMRGIPEHSVLSIRSLSSMPDSTYQESNDDPQNDAVTVPPPPATRDDVQSAFYPADPSANGTKGEAQNVATSQGAPQNNNGAMDQETTKTEESVYVGGISESTSLLSRLSSNISNHRSIDDSEDDSMNGDNFRNRTNNNSSAQNEQVPPAEESASEWTLPGDSPVLRGALVVGTYLIAMSVPNVQSLVSLVGAVTGSSTALLIPPILELAYLSHKEAMELQRTRPRQSFPPMGDWEGGPSAASKRSLFGYSSVGTIHNNKNKNGNNPLQQSARSRKRRNRYFWERTISWCLLILGSIFAVVGSYFSVIDILQSYS